VSASPETLHLLAHQAQLRARTDADWWDNPLDTALAAVSATRHPPAFRGDGETAVQRLRRWLRDGQPRRVSADVAALALAACAASDLGLRDRELEAAAVEGAADLAGRSRTAAPPLHVGLTVWALDSLVPDRAAAPWPALRQHLAAGPVGRGAEAPVVALATALCAPVFDADALVRSLLSDVPSSPSLEDGAMLLWVLTTAVERCAPELGAQDTGLRALADRRAELAVRLAQELDAEAFKAPEVADFDPRGDLDLRTPTFLSPMEALLLDISLASRELEQPWLRFEEAADLFGLREREAVRSLAWRTAVLLGAAGVVAGGLLAVVLDYEGSDRLVAVLAGIAVACAVAFVAAVIWQREDRGAFSRALIAFFFTLTICAVLDLINESLDKPLLSDAAGVIGGLLGATVIAVVVAATASGQRSD
jgi:hypothetical protein